MVRVADTLNKKEKAMKQRTIQYSFPKLWRSLIAVAPGYTDILRSCFREYEAWYRLLAFHRGDRDAVKTLKGFHNIAKRIAMEQPIPRFVKFGDMWVRTFRNGVPRALPRIHALFRSRHRILLLCALSITSGYLFITLPALTTLKEIHRKYSGSLPSEEDLKLDLPPLRELFSHRDRFVRDPAVILRQLVIFCRWFIPRWKVPFEGRKDKHVFSGFKGGPYGAPSFRYLPRDAYTLLLPKFQNIFDACIRFAVKYKGEPFAQSFRNRLYEARRFFFEVVSPTHSGAAFRRGFKNPPIAYDDFPRSEEPRLATFSFLSEKGGKTRIITACNYWIQFLLFPFHHDMMSVLGRIDCDYAFDQDRAADFFNRMLKKVRCAFSFDMTGATDRFPRWFQAFCLNCWKPGLGDAWEEIMSMPIYDKHSRTFSSFAAGQPMGVYSSWPVFSWCHHLLIRFSAWMCGLNPFTFDVYAVLGDDMSALNRKVSRVYHYVLTVVFGVAVSESKSVTCNRTSKPAAEFAKRNYVAGREVSAISPIMLESMATGEDLSLVRDIVERVLFRWKVKVNSHSQFVCELFKAIMPPKMGNIVMPWFLSPDVRLRQIDLTGRLDEILNEWWPHWAADYGFASKARRAQQKETFKSMKSKLREATALLSKMYHLPLKEDGSTRDGRLILCDYYAYLEYEDSVAPGHENIQIGPRRFMKQRIGPVHHLQAVLEAITKRVNTLSRVEDPGRDYYRLMVLVNHYHSFFTAEFSRGNYYSQVKSSRVLENYSLGLRVKEFLTDDLRREAWASQEGRTKVEFFFS